MSVDIEQIRACIRQGNLTVSPHALIEAKKDGISPKAAQLLEEIALCGEVIEDYPECHRCLICHEVVVNIMLPKKRHCPECAGNMEYRLIDISYQEKDIDVAIKIIDVPALVCSKCNFQLISISIAKGLDVLVDAIFASLRKQKSPLEIFHSVDVSLAFNQNAVANM